MVMIARMYNQPDILEQHSESGTLLLTLCC